jgi:hypothetical protein
VGSRSAEDVHFSSNFGQSQKNANFVFLMIMIEVENAQSTTRSRACAMIDGQPFFRISGDRRARHWYSRRYFQTRIFPVGRGEMLLLRAILD